jgi:predicted AlkP superfamily phosphohydrolase/phosphomutase
MSGSNPERGSDSNSNSNSGPGPNAEGAFVLGLDGVPWELLSRWARAGHLPNVARLMEEGAAGPLESSKPANTPVAWPAIATGTWADSHGIYEFYELTAEHSKRPYTRNDLRQPALWDMLSPAVVGNVPMTYPPAPIDGKMVSGMMTPSVDETFTHPPELREELLERVEDYTIALYWDEYEGSEERFLEDLQALVETRRELLRLLMETPSWRLFFFVFTAPDRLQHLIWDEDRIREHYEYLDEIVGEVLDYCDAHGSSLYVVSDHGFGPVSKSVHPNRALADRGILAERDNGGSRSLLSSFGVTRDRLVRAIDATGIDVHGIAKRLPTSVVDSVAEQLPGDHGLYDVDFSITKAFFYGIGNVYVNDTRRFDAGIVPPSEVKAVKRDVMTALGGLADPETGGRVLDVYDGDELFPDDPDSPDVVVQPRADYSLSASLAPEAVSASGSVAATHRSEGIFLARGPNVAAGSHPEGASLVDVAPTILHDLGEPIPAATDGRILTELFEPGSAPAERQPEIEAYRTDRTTADVADDFGDVEERLRGLGYVE